jgi:uncharacterized protein with HEPN domain
MLRAAEDAMEFTSGVTRDQFDGNKEKQYAVARAIEIVGEAATAVDEEERALHPQIPWRQITGMRIILAHQYFRVDPDIVWGVASTQLEPLVEQLRAILPPEGQS